MPMTCEGCKHYLKRPEECAALRGYAWCANCKRQWALEDRIGCPRCAEVKQAVDLSECPGAVPSVRCPGRVERVTEKTQGALF